jgi:trimeric autotransporter adhesin
MTTVPYTFGSEPSPIPLSQLDANFAVTPAFANTAGNVTNSVQANITAVGILSTLSVSGTVNSGNIVNTGTLSSGNITTVGTVTTTGDTDVGANLNVVSSASVGGNITTSASIIGAGTALVGNLLTGGQISGAGNITGANVVAVGSISASTNINAIGNVIAQTQVSAVGNIITDAFFIGAFQGSIVGNIVGAPGSNTQVLFNTSGNVDAVGGMTYNKGSNVFTVLGVISAQGNVISTGNLSLTRNATIGGNLSVGGIATMTGFVTAPTPVTGTANNQVATTAFVNNQINQYANNVAITGGTVSVFSVASNTSVTANSVSANVISTTTWTIREFDGALFFQASGTNIAKLDTSGNFTTIGNVTGFGTL